ncbi:MAG: YhcH/YjgK/YiaL family protein [Bacteroidaceae bacterium]|nr:YhcH/YjgK/YiaL family protein [Bacteroidaceae bacterium]
MILTTLKDSDRYNSLHPYFKQVFDYIKQNDLANVEPGRITLIPEKLFINVCDAKLIERENQKLEVHRKYIDIHLPLSAPETIGWAPLNALGESENPFNETDDFALYPEEATIYFTVLPGQALIVYPEDAHAPIIGQGTLRKLIVKVILEA